jgi:hypothetical protein
MVLAAVAMFVLALGAAVLVLVTGGFTDETGRSPGAPSMLEPDRASGPERPDGPAESELDGAVGPRN